MAARLTLLEVERTRQPQAPAMADNKKFNGWLVYTANQKNHGRDDVSSLGANVPKLFGNALANDLLHSVSSSSIPSTVRDSDGMALNFDGADDFIYTKNRFGVLGVNKDQTFLIIVKFTSTPSDVALIGHFSSDYNMTDYGRGIGISGGTIHSFGCNGSNGQIINSGITPVVGALYCIAARCSTNGGLFINGVKYGAASLDMAWEYAFAIGATGGIPAGSGIGGRRLTGKVYLAAAADFSHTDNYLQAITKNPWQIFEPEEIPLFKPITIGATLAQTESADTASGAASVSIAASLAVTESADTATSAANVPLSASLAVTEANDSLASVATVAIAASLSVTESADTVSASATIIDGVNASLSSTESADTLSASVTVPLSANLSYTESADSASGSATVTINATATLTETGDSISGVSVVEITATASLTESADSLSASATLVDGISASLNVTEAADTLAAVANAAIAAALASSEAGDELSAQAEIALSAALNAVESGDTVVSSVGVSITCSASLSEDGDTLTATASIISDSNTITAASMVRLAEIWARMELDATKPLVTSATQLTVGTISQDISTGGAVRTGAALVPSIDPDTMIEEVWQRLGLDPDNSLTQTNTSIDVGDIHLTVSGTDTLTVQRV